MASPARERFAWFLEVLRTGRFTESELASGFTESFLEQVSPATLWSMSRQLAPEIGDTGPEVSDDGEHRLSARLEQFDAVAWVEAQAPYRFNELIFRPRVDPIADPRLTGAQWSAVGDSGVAVDLLRRASADGAVVGVVAAGFDGRSAEPVWGVAGGFADVDAGTAMELERRMFVGSITKLLTAVSVLRLVAAGAIGLKDSANDHLEAVRIGSDEVTVERLLAHTAGVCSNFAHYVSRVPSLPELLGREVGVEFRPGSRHAYSNGGYAMLGEIIATVRGLPYHEAVKADVLEPLAMHNSEILLSWPADAPRGYQGRGGKLFASPELVPSVPAAGGLYATVGDLARLVNGWRALLPGELSTAALDSHVEITSTLAQGYGWAIANANGRRIAGHGGGTLGSCSSLWWDPEQGVASFVLLNLESGPAETINLELLERAF
jgi:CubicO group peptidase (beta-lactamase class C family)